MIQLWETNTLLLLAKLFFMAISVIYAIFAFMLVRQVSLMNQSFTTPLHAFFTFCAWAHFVVSLLVVLIVFISF